MSVKMYAKVALVGSLALFVAGCANEKSRALDIQMSKSVDLTINHRIKMAFLAMARIVLAVKQPLFW